MRFFTAIAAFGLVALATAQNATTTHTSAELSSAAATSVASATATASLSPQVRCLQSCGSADVCCQAKCVGVPCPSQSQVNATTECAAACPQGNGTQAETDQYASCQASCISSYFLTNSATTAPTASQTGDNTASATGTFAFGGSSTTGSGSATAGASASASATGSSGNGADNLHVGSVGLGFLALVMAGLAL